LADKQSASVKRLFAFSSNTFDGIEKLTALNLQVVKVTLAERQALMARALSAKPEELVALSTSFAKPTVEKIAAYNRQVYEMGRTDCVNRQRTVSIPACRGGFRR